MCRTPKYAPTPNNCSYRAALWRIVHAAINAQEFAADQDAFFNAFVAAYVKLAAAGATWRAA
eukprot:361292-Chlamydomonas_euryale.AAC.3